MSTTLAEIEQEFVDHFLGGEFEKYTQSVLDDLGYVDASEVTFADIWSEFIYEGLASLRYKSDEDPHIPLPSGPARLIEDFGGEDQGSTRWVVFSVGDRLFRVSGYYNSWDGDVWDDPNPEEVVPEETIKIIYVGKDTNV